MWSWFYDNKEKTLVQENKLDVGSSSSSEEQQPSVVKCLLILDNGESQVPMDVPAQELKTLFDVFDFTQKAISSGENPISVKKCEKSRNCFWYDTVIPTRGVVVGFDPKTNQCMDYDPNTVPDVKPKKVTTRGSSNKKVKFEK